MLGHGTHRSFVDKGHISMDYDPDVGQRGSRIERGLSTLFEFLF